MEVLVAKHRAPRETVENQFKDMCVYMYRGRGRSGCFLLPSSIRPAAGGHAPSFSHPPFLH